MTKLSINMLAKVEMCVDTTNCILHCIQTLRDICSEFNLVMNQSDLPKGRSRILTEWYDKASPGDKFLFIDSDQTFTPSDVQTALFHSENYDIVCATYARKNGMIAAEPIKKQRYYDEKKGELYFGPTGFMLINYEIVDKLVKTMKKVRSASEERIYPFFHHQIFVDDTLFPGETIWIGEDYSFCHIARKQGARIFGFISDTVGHIIPTETFPAKVAVKKWPKDSVVIFCGETKEKWDGRSLEKGIGGSESAVIRLSEYWTKKGKTVSVFCNCEKDITVNGVFYTNEVFNYMDIYDVLILWRGALLSMMQGIPEARVCISDLHDVVEKASITNRMLTHVDKFCVKSAFHASMLPDNTPKDKIAIIPNGGKVDRDEVKKDNNYILYASSYDRGLAYMLKWGWPKIKAECPNAYLKVFYGWNTFDKMNDLTNPDIKLYKDVMLQLLNQDGVEECGRVANSELMKEKAKANIHYYVGNFQEIDCITVRESASVGCIPIVSTQGHVFKEKSYCIKIDGDPNIRKTQEDAADYIIDLIKNPKKADKVRKECKVPELERWDNVAEEWLKLF